MKGEAPAETRVGIRMSVLLHPQMHHSTSQLGESSCSSVPCSYNTSTSGGDEQGRGQPRAGAGTFSVFGQSWLKAELVVQLPAFATSFRRGISGMPFRWKI